MGVEELSRDARLELIKRKTYALVKSGKAGNSKLVQDIEWLLAEIGRLNRGVKNLQSLLGDQVDINVQLEADIERQRALLDERVEEIMRLSNAAEGQT